MRGDEFAVARQPLPDCENDPSGVAFAERDGALPPMANQFTPINPTERFRQTPRRASLRQHTAVMPPFRPGQRYGGAPAEWEEPLAPPPYTETSPPYDNALMPAYSQDPAMAQEELRRYQQKYWAELEGAPEILDPAASYPAISGEATQIPAYLQKAQMPPFVCDDWSARDGWSSALPSTERLDWPPQEQWTYPAAPPEGEWEQAEEYTRVQGDPWEMDTSPAESGFAGDDWERPLTQHPPDSPPVENRISKAKLATGIVTAIILMFCAVQIGRVVLVMMENEEEMKNVRAEYYALTGNDLAGDASRVELPPKGQTFAPTAIPETPTPAPVATARGNDQAVGGLGGETASEPTALPRVRLKSYADNPLGIIREEFLPPLQENPDIVGKLVISGMVEEMVVQRNNTYYLNHNSRGTFGAMGAVFVDEGYSIKKPPENLLLRGQSTLSGKLFEPLAQFVTGGVGFFRQHAVFQFNTLYEEGEYVLLAVIVAASDPSSPDYFNYAAYSSFQTDGQMESYVAGARQHSIYEIPVEVQASDRLLTLSTLGEGGDKQCLVLLARKLRPGETASSFTVALQSVRLR